MHIVTLMENTPGMPGCAYEHGLSFYAETAHHKILLDTGASDAFMKNAELLGIDLSQVDTVILSHGHYDHSGGIIPFTRLNPDTSAKTGSATSASTGTFWTCPGSLRSRAPRRRMMKSIFSPTLPAAAAIQRATTR